MQNTKVKINFATYSAPALSHQQKEWAYNMWCIGYTHQQIGAALNVCYKTVQRAIHGRPRIRPVLTYPGYAMNA